MSTHVLSLSRPSVGFDVRRWAGWLPIAVIGGGAEFQPKVEATAVDLPMALQGTLGSPGSLGGGQEQEKQKELSRLLGRTSPAPRSRWTTLVMLDNKNPKYLSTGVHLTALALQLGSSTP